MEQVGTNLKTRSANRNKPEENGEIGTNRNKSPSADPKLGAPTLLLHEAKGTTLVPL